MLFITNALNQVTRMTYDQNGNMTNLVDALFRTNRWFYDLNGRETQSVSADGLRLTKGYDSIGRLTAVTNHGSGLYLHYTYDNLDRMRDTTFPDGTANHFEYSCCGLDWSRDRLNRVTSYARDALGRTIAVTDPENRLAEFRYNGADQITNLITWVNGQARVKRFEYTSTNGFSRLTRVITPAGKLIRYDYTFRGGLAWREDGNGRVTKYQYDPLQRLVSVTDAGGVELVHLDYDALGNVTHVASTNSVFDYAYDPLNRATNVVCLLTNIPGFATVKYKLDYSYDPVGNVSNRVITGLQGMSGTITTRYAYDAMNRLTNVVQLTNGAVSASAWYQYDAAGRLWKKGYGNGDVATHSYDSESRLLSLGITNNNALITAYTYGWDAGGNILAITNNGTNVTLYGYDRAGQLTNEIAFTNGLPGRTTNIWVYDEAGNWLNASAGGKWLYDADNELLARAPADTPSTPAPVSVTVTGEVEPGPASNKWYHTTAACRGVEGLVSQSDGTFSLPGVPVDQWGQNALVVSVTDVSGNQGTELRRVTRPVPAALERFAYDGNGNLTNWVNGTDNWAYEWDGADRLVKVTKNGTAVLRNWYDANGRRIAKQETASGQTHRWLYLYDGWGLCAVMNESCRFLETYTHGRGLGGAVGTLVAITTWTDGTITPGSYYIHHNHRGDVVLTRSGTATVGTCAYSAFGTTRSQTGMEVCRFKFSSKEQDLSTGFSYYGYRFYVSQWQRWLSTDPLGERSANNLYAVVGNDPLARFDPLGLAYGNPVSGPNGPVGPTGPYDPGYPYYPDGVFYRRNPGLSCLAELANAVRMFLGNAGYEGYPTANDDDKLQHCITSCRIGRACGNSLSWLAGWLKESSDLVHGGSSGDSVSDLNADAVGRKGAKCRDKSCEDYCQENRGNY